MAYFRYFLIFTLDKIFQMCYKYTKHKRRVQMLNNNHFNAPISPVLLFVSLYILVSMITHDSGTISLGGTAFGAILAIVSILVMIAEFKAEDRLYPPNQQ